jgi:hypothetical protein
VSVLERRCRLLLRAYPAGYREIRGQEIIGTLLEATPPGRTWPMPRDMRSLVAGGLKARAAQRRRLTAAVNLRLAVLLGVSIYLSNAGMSYLASFGRAELEPGVTLSAGVPAWSVPLVGLLLTAAAAAAWVGRRAVVVPVALAAAGVVAFDSSVAPSYLIGPIATLLLCLAALIVLSRRAERPEPRWLWLAGLFAAGQLLPYIGPYGFLLDLSIALACLAWIGIDARPALALATLLLLFSLPGMLDPLAWGSGLSVPNPILLIAGVIAALAGWRLRRQSARREPA